MTCDFHTPLPAKLGAAMVAAHWAANGTNQTTVGAQASEQPTVTPATGDELTDALPTEPPIAGYDQPGDDPRSAAPHCLPRDSIEARAYYAK